MRPPPSHKRLGGTPVDAGRRRGGQRAVRPVSGKRRSLVEEGVVRAAELAPSVECERRVAKGQPNAVFLEESQGCTLVVAARRRQGTVRELVLGSISRHILNNAECPVVVIPILTPRKTPAEAKRRSGILTPSRRAGRPRCDARGAMPALPAPRLSISGARRCRPGAASRSPAPAPP